MHAALRPYFNTGVALVGASAVALAPVVIQPPQLSALEHSVMQAVTQDVDLMTLEEVFGAFNSSVTAFLGGLAVGLGLDVQAELSVDADLGTNVGIVVSALIDNLTGAFATNPFEGLFNLAVFPVNAVIGIASGVAAAVLGEDGLINNLFGAVTEFIGDLPGLGDLFDSLPGLGDLTGVFDVLPDVDGVGDLLALPMTLITNLVGALPDLGGLLGGLPGLDELLGDVSGGLLGLVTAPITVGVNLAGLGAELFIEGSAAITAAIGDVLGGFLDAGEALLTGVGLGVTQGATLLTNLLSNAVTLVTEAIGDTAVLVGGAASTGAAALGQIVAGLQGALAEFDLELDGEVGAGVDVTALSGAAVSGLAASELPGDRTNLRTLSLAAADASPDAESKPVPPVVSSDQGKGDDVTATVKDPELTPGKERAEQISEGVSGGKAGGVKDIPDTDTPSPAEPAPPAQEAPSKAPEAPKATKAEKPAKAGKAAEKRAAKAANQDKQPDA